MWRTVLIIILIMFLASFFGFSTTETNEGDWIYQSNNILKKNIFN
jgi:hypothetical protein